MFALYVAHPFGTFRETPESSFADLESAIDAAFKRIAEIVPNCRVWIQHGETRLALMN